MIEPKVMNFTYETVPDDPINLKIRTLSNGLKLFMSVNPNEPRIYTNIVVRAGSKQDPSDTTGLAHYMEHMLFKGTSKIGALDWEKEKVFLQQISDLYELHRAAKSQKERRRIYQEIDRLSFEAAKLVAPNEYDKLSSALGAKETNAYTWVEQTVFVNEIPSNELERWMKLESERFRMMALRLFHTELETVYEEFNISQDNDHRKSNNVLREALFPNHPYGAQTTIGSGEHLKNPSQVKIQEYFHTYYVPNNMAIMLAGDFDPDRVVILAEKYFGQNPPKKIPAFSFQPEQPLKKPVHKEVFGQEAPYVDVAWRFGGSRTDDQWMLALIRGILYNGHAGLFDEHLNRRQKILESEAWCWFYEDYSVLGLYGRPRQGQSLEEVEGILLEMIEKLRRGEFEEWLLEAVTNDLKLDQIKAFESNSDRVSAMTYAFILGIDWERFIRRIDWLKNVTKQQLVDFVRENLSDNYVAIYKKQGPDPNVVKVEKPLITPVEINRHAISDFGRQFLEQAPAPIQPLFSDFSGNIHSRRLNNGSILDYVENTQNELFRLDYIFEMGKNSDRKLALALQYLPYLGTARYSADDLQKEFFRLGLKFEVNNNDERCYLTLKGLDSSLEEGLHLLHHILAGVAPKEDVLKNVISDILVKRANAKQDKSFILRQAMASYARFGAFSPFTFRLSEKELRDLQAEELISRIKALPFFHHRVYYYGPRNVDKVTPLFEKVHRTDKKLIPPIQPKEFPELPTAHNKVFFLDFPMVQAEVLLLSRGTPYFNIEEHLMRDMYNEYFGYGLSSIVFQEIRESKALAYSTFAVFTSPKKKDRAHYIQAFLGTQPDKLMDAIPALLDIIEHMPVVEGQIENARYSILRRIESERVTPSHLYWQYRAVQDLGYHHDLAFDIYEHLKKAGVKELCAFHEQFVKGRAYHLLVIGSRDQIDMNFLNSFGELQELTLEEVFGY
jgi:predicted Zn-dependent peptidase